MQKLGRNCRDLIYSFLCFKEIKNLLLLNRNFYKEIISYLKTNLSYLNDIDLINYSQKTIIKIFHDFKQIKHLIINCVDIKIHKISLDLSNNMISLKLINIDPEDFLKFIPNFINKAKSLKKLSISFYSFEETSHLTYLNLNKEIEEDYKKDYFAFMDNLDNLSKLTLKINKLMSLKKSFRLFLNLLINGIERLNSKSELKSLSLSNFKIFRISNYILFNNINFLKIKNENNPQDNFDFSEFIFGYSPSSLYFIKKSFPNLNSIIIIDYSLFDFEEYSDILNEFFIWAKNFKCLCLNNYNNDISYYTINELDLMNLFIGFNNLSTLGLSSNKSFNNSILQQICMNNYFLIDINLDYTNFDDLGAEILINSNCIKLIEKISLAFCKKLTHKGLAILFQSFEKLKYLNVKGLKNLRNKTLKILNENDNLQNIEIAYFHENKLKNEIIEDFLFKFRKSLKILEISKIDVLGKFSSKFLWQKKFKIISLNKLDLSYNLTAVNCELIKSISEIFPNLKVLNVKNCDNFTNSSIIILNESLLKFSLNKLHLGNCKKLEINNSFLNEISKFKNLTYLHLNSNQEKDIRIAVQIKRNNQKFDKKKIILNNLERISF